MVSSLKDQQDKLKRGRRDSDGQRMSPHALVHNEKTFWRATQFLNSGAMYQICNDVFIYEQTFKFDRRQHRRWFHSSKKVWE